MRYRLLGEVNGMLTYCRCLFADCISHSRAQRHGAVERRPGLFEIVLDDLGYPIDAEARGVNGTLRIVVGELHLIFCHGLAFLVFRRALGGPQARLCMKNDIGKASFQTDLR
jgi:hypothetical protein